ncbi:MAG: hypothetical protein D8M58_14770 [Calditrichaeota bacterium]|nr:MAG: hypothetical protein DWQ03_16010 [Calditrichota bacterium]MBL1206666.1 hypothetical protein [Calditrichota bacterium]NOG46493.1 hypothetical protein [Calditrichota bacterium]
MSSKQPNETAKIKQFGYVVSAVLLIISNIGLINEWPYTPIFFILMMYFLTGSLWGPGLIRIFYNIFGKHFFKNENEGENKPGSDHFSKN